MKAILCKQWGSPEDLVFDEIASPQPKDDEVLISVKAVGVNYPDVLMIAGKYQAKPPFPFIPCGEVAGVIKALGKNVKHLHEGMRVAAMCGTGGLAEEVCVSAMQALPVPDEMDFETAASFMVVYGTSHLGLLHRAGLKKGETLLVHGAAGGVGLAAIDIARNLGVNIIATASTAEKLQKAQEVGAHHLINYTEDDFVEKVKEITKGKGADVIFDPVGGDVFDKSLKVLAWEGRLLIVGFAGGRIPEAPANLLLLKNASLVGLFWGNYAVKNPGVLIGSLQELMQWFKEGKIKPYVSQTFPLSEAAKALRVLADRKALGKVAVSI